MNRFRDHLGSDDPISIDDIRPRLRRPETPDEIRESDALKSALQGAVIKSAILIRPTRSGESVSVRITLKGATPEAAWAHWLVIRIVPAGHPGWLARMVAFHPNRREIFAIPRPGTSDEAYAYTLRLQRELPIITSVHLGAMLEKTFFKIGTSFVTHH